MATEDRIIYHGESEKAFTVVNFLGGGACDCWELVIWDKKRGFLGRAAEGVAVLQIDPEDIGEGLEEKLAAIPEDLRRILVEGLKEMFNDRS